MRKTVKAKTLYDCIDAVVEMTTRKLRISVAYKLAVSLRSLKNEHTLLEEQREAILDRYAEKDEKGRRIMGERNPVTGSPTWRLKDAKGFEKEWGELINQDVILELRPVKLEEFGQDFEVEPLTLENAISLGVVECDTKEEEPKKEEETPE